MGRVIIQEATTKNPYELMGFEAGICYGSDISDPEKNVKRGKQCLSDGHGRVAELPQIYLTLDGYSARVIREWYTHIGGDPTRLQASTRYIDYAKKGFSYITPSSIKHNLAAEIKWDALMKHINNELVSLERDYNIPKEDVANGLPLGMTTIVITRTNLRNIIDMVKNRKCRRAYWEFRDIIKDLEDALSKYSPQWKEIVEKEFKCKCDILGYCPEKHGCGRYPQKVDN